MNWNTIRRFVTEHASQSHLCICNNDLFDASIAEGIYGFPHSGTNRAKSFWRSIASMCNVGVNDLIFLYRTNGENAGCKEIHGPFRIFDVEGQPSTFYELNAEDFPIYINDEIDCKVKFLYSAFENEIYSIADNYQLIARYETREIWGYRHPAVMNIGAARKKSVSTFTNRHTHVFIDLLEQCGVLRETLDQPIPSHERIEHLEDLEPTITKFKIDGSFLASNYSEDEAFLYSFFISALKNNANYYSHDVFTDFSAINNHILERENIAFEDLINNIMLEVIITTHLQDELDVVLTSLDDATILFLEFKVGMLNQRDINQVQNYISILNVIWPRKNIFANLVGSGKEMNLVIGNDFIEKIRLVEYTVTQQNQLRIRFNDITR